jgi:hypothetical protein
MNHAQPIAVVAMQLVCIATLGACTPTVKVATDEPITINLNVNIRHEILVKVDKQLDTAIDGNSDIF